tara:strand:+ start:1067 stop:1270 length:204 start_codon:yes stop_codon:yes gene_type:complete
MFCNSKLKDTVLAIIIIVFAWPGLISWAYSAWVVVVAGALLLIHAWVCKSCVACTPEQMAKSVKKKK